MDILLVFAGLAGAAGLASLIQSKPLPSEAEALKALEKLDKNPDDPEANLVAGKYKAFVLGDYKEGMAFLVKSSDKTLKTLAEHELDPKHTVSGLQKVGMGDEWVLAARKFPALFRIFYDRASHWYIAGWPELGDFWKEKTREQGLKLAAARPSGGPRKAIPSKWTTNAGAATALDGTIARTGSYSIKLPAGDPKVPNSENGIQSDLIPIPFDGKEVEFSAYVLTDKTEGQTDQLYVSFFDRIGSLLLISAVKVPPDLPFWNRIGGKVKTPEGATGLRIGTVVRSKKGAGWVDDVSVKIDGKEIAKNPSFEER